MYLKEGFWLLLLCCGLGVLSRPMDVEVGSCDSSQSELLADPQAEAVDYGSLDDDGSAQEAECMDPKAQAQPDKAERKDTGEEKKEEDSNNGKFQESELDGESSIAKRESRYQQSDYASCDSQKSFYEDEDVAKYRDAFGGFPQDSGRGKRVKRFFYHY